MKEYKAIIFDMGGVLLNLGAMWTGTGLFQLNKL